MTPTCIVCGEDVDPNAAEVQTWHDALACRVDFAHASHPTLETHAALLRMRPRPSPFLDPDYWPMELAHPYDPIAERDRAAEARANAQTAALVEGKTRARRVVHDLAPSMADRDPTSVLDDDPCPNCMESGAHICDGVRVDRWTPQPRMITSMVRVARLDADNRPTGPSIPMQTISLVMHHVDGGPMNNDPANLAVVPAIARGGMTDEDYARFGLKA